MRLHFAIWMGRVGDEMSASRGEIDDFWLILRRIGTCSAS